jgi:predicted DNA-binding transcriptional regulator AlpA
MHIDKQERALPSLVSQKEVLGWLGITRPTLVALVRTKGFPSAIRVGARRVAYRVSEVDSWLESRRERVA